jgi:hypothetical protein
MDLGAGRRWAGSSNLVLGEAPEHPTLRTNDAIDDLGLIAYAGVPASS